MLDFLTPLMITSILRANPLLLQRVQVKATAMGYMDAIVSGNGKASLSYVSPDMDEAREMTACLSAMYNSRSLFYRIAEDKFGSKDVASIPDIIDPSGVTFSVIRGSTTFEHGDKAVLYFGINNRAKIKLSHKDKKWLITDIGGVGASKATAIQFYKKMTMIFDQTTNLIKDGKYKDMRAAISAMNTDFLASTRPK